MKLKTKFLIKGLFHSLFQFLAIFSFAWYNSCLFEMLVIYICFFYFRNKFEKQYHALTTWGCTFLTFIIFYFVSLVTPNRTISILLVILFTYNINTISYFYRDYLDIKEYRDNQLNKNKKYYDKITNKKKKNVNRQIIIEILGNDNLDEESIEKYCVSKGIPKLSETIYLFLNNTLEETADILDVDNSTITRRIKKFIEVGFRD